jgi:alkanesulfonate monooxygenase SsuD/methylene tetrahydromethanopterin reductase-like flavin-dependent oxidoreductase (luciferase family)
VYKHKVEVLKKQCKAIGRDFLEIEKSCWPSEQVLIAENESELNKKISQRKPANVGLENFRKNALSGTPNECLEQLQAYVDLGVNYFMLFFGDMPDLDGLRQFAKGVVNRIS